MKFLLSLATLFLLAIPLYAEITDKEIIAIINKVQLAYLVGTKPPSKS